MAPPSRVPASAGRSSSSAAVRKPAHAAAVSSKRIKKSAPAAALAAVSSKPIKKTSRPPTSSPKLCPVASSRKKQPTGTELMAPPAVEAVHPFRRLSCGTAVVARTKSEIAEKLSLVMWLPARVVSASGANHYVVKYAAELENLKFAGKVVRLPVEHIKPALSWAFSIHCRQPSRP